MSNDTTVKSDMSVALDIKALSQRIRDLELFPEMGFQGRVLRDQRRHAINGISFSFAQP